MPAMIDTALSQGICRRTETEPDKVSWKGRIIRAVVNSDEVDYHQTVLMPDGCRYDNFLNNQGGVVLWLHGNDPVRGALPIGNVRSIERQTKDGRRRLLAEIDLDEDDEFTEKVKRKYLLRKWRGWSVRALPREHSAPTNAELRAHPDWSDAHTIFRSWDLVEISATPLQSNQSAVTEDFTRSARGLESLRGTADGFYEVWDDLYRVYRWKTVRIDGKEYKTNEAEGIAWCDLEGARRMTDKSR
jgi:hypothetical protein